MKYRLRTRYANFVSVTSKKTSKNNNFMKNKYYFKILKRSQVSGSVLT